MALNFQSANCHSYQSLKDSAMRGMKPPAPQTSSRRVTRPRSRRKGSSSGRKPKRLVSPAWQGGRRRGKENQDAQGLGSFLSPDTLRHTSKSPGAPTVMTPPPFSFSFGSELNDEVLSYMDRLDSAPQPAISSTPLSFSQGSATGIKTAESRANDSSAPLFDATNSFEIREQYPTSVSVSTPGYSQPKAPNRSSFLTTPAKDSRSNLRLSSWGIPPKVLEQYERRGIKSMFEWQAECLSLPGILSGGNLVYSAPTSAGKTLIAELLALKCVLESQKKVIIILPFVSVAQEKTNYLTQVFESVGVKVGGFMGGHSPAGGFAATDIAICTIEKANSLVNRLLEENSTQQLGTVVVDELHMIGDSHRGYLLELLLTKLMYVSRKGKIADSKSKPEGAKLRAYDTIHSQLSPFGTAIQLIGMSATLPNLSTLASWLGAQLYHTDFRPVPLKEMVKIGPTLYDTAFKKLRGFDESAELLPGDEDGVLLLCRDTVLQGRSVLIFCPTKAWCENLASTAATAPFLRSRGQQSAEPSTLVDLDRPGLVSVCEQLRRTQVGLDRVLGRCIPNGVAFHHAGLTFEEREIVEGAFRQSLIKILVATSTLSSGVNLPARLVIVRTPFFQRSLLDVLVYKQMVGRAGRKGVDEAGESVLVCKLSERSKVVSLLKSTPKPVQSCLGQKSSGGGNSKPRSGSEVSAMRRALLEVVASGTATTTCEIEAYASCTLLFAELRKKVAKSPAKDPTKSARSLLRSTIEFLAEHEFIATRSTSCKTGLEPGETEAELNLEYYATQLGMATVASALSPEEALVVFAELRRARRSFVLENELHTVYLVTPVYIQDQWPSIDWYKYLCLWERLPPDMKHVADILGITESFLARAIQGRLAERTAAQRESLRVHRRFFTALALHDLVHEVSVVEVARKYGAAKGLLQTLQGAAGTFAGMVTVFCGRLGWKNLEYLLEQFQSRLTFGVERELCDLIRISLLNGFRARVLYNTGFHTLAAIATANPNAIETCLRNAVPFKSSRLASEGEKKEDTGVCTTWCAKLRRGMRESEAAEAIVREARAILSEELNVPVAVWSASNPAVMRAPLSELDVKHNQPASANRLNSEMVVVKPATTVPAVSSIESIRGQRKSPNVESSFTGVEIKKPRLRDGPRENEMYKRPPTKKQTSPTATSVAKQFSLSGEQTALEVPPLSLPCGPIPVPESSIPIPISSDCSKFPNSTTRLHDAPCPNFVAASSLLKRANTTPAQTELQQLTLNTSLLRPPLHPEPFQSGTQSQTSANPNKTRTSSFEAANLQKSPDLPLAIPDSLSSSLDMSMCFSFQTYAMIDAACNAEVIDSSRCHPDPSNLLGDCEEKITERDTKKKQFEACVIAESPLPSNDGHDLGLVVANTASDRQLENDPVLETQNKIHSTLQHTAGSSDSNNATAPVLRGNKDMYTRVVNQKTPTRDSTRATRSKVPLPKSPVPPSSLVEPPVLPSPLPQIPVPPTQPTSVETLQAKTPLPMTPILPSTLPQTPIPLSQSTKELSLLCCSHLSQSGVTVIDVTTNQLLFETFVSECLEQEVLSFSVATRSANQRDGIGSMIVKPQEAAGVPISNSNEQVVGVAFCWGDTDVYYVSLCQEDGDCDPIRVLTRIEALRKIFSDSACRERVIAYDLKSHAKAMARSSIGLLPSGAVLDPRVADWMLNPDAKEKTIHKMVLQYLPDQPALSEEEGCEDTPLSSLATRAGDPRMRAAAESVLACLLMSKLEMLLSAEGLYEPFVRVEMPSLLILAKMEINGIGFSSDECSSQKFVLETRLSELEREAYTLAGRSFSLTSPEDVSQVLFIDLKLPPGAEGKNQQQQKTLGANSRRSKKRIQHFSTAKDVLEKLKPLHPLPGIVLEWRRISSTVTKVVFPLFKEAVVHNGIQSVRIHATCQFHTATGRVAFSDPNLQMVPKEYDIGSPGGSLHESVPKFSLKATGDDVLLSESQCLRVCETPEDERKATATPSSVCMRNVFVPFPGGIFVAADYSQLELRILAHVSGDSKLRQCLNGEGDVFRMIAGEWQGLPPEEVSDKQRQEAKQVCYGMIYGIGVRALGEQLGVSDNEASQFMESFKSKYPAVKKFVAKTVQDCRDRGHVCTLLGRKRFLPGIRSQNVHARSQAERQAVNSTIQGSAADLVKTAMVNIDRRLAREFPGAAPFLTYCEAPPATQLTTPTAPLTTPTSRLTTPTTVSGSHFVLQLHDELIYEVSLRDLREVTAIIRYEMENALELSVKFPVKVKVGYSWGKLESYAVT